MDVSVVVGNPKPSSRTLDAAVLLAERIGGGPPPRDVVDLALLGPSLLGWGDPAVEEAMAAVRRSQVVIVASPTFKATYSGLLKLFLDQFEGGTGLFGTVAVPLMLGAGPTHALAPELTLKPVLAELGASCPTPGLYLTDKTFREDGRLDEFAARWGPVVRATSGAWTEVSS